MRTKDRATNFQIETSNTTSLLKLTKAVMAGDSHIIYSVLTIDGKEILSENNFDVRINQKTGSHDEFKISCPTEALEGYGAYPLSETRNFLGKSITIELKQFGQSALRYTGIISSLKHRKFDGFEGHIIISGHSPTILLENGLECQSYENKSLKEIIEATLQGYPQEAINADGIPSGIPSLNARLPYIVQYKETDFEFLNRLALRFGEWFYYNGQQLVFGPADGRLIELVEEQNLYEFELKMQLVPQKFSYTGYSEKHAEGYAVDSDSESVPNSINPFQRFAIEASENVYGKIPQNHVNQSLDGGDRDLRELVKRQKAKRQNVLFLEGRSNNPNLRLGDRAKITAYMPDNLKSMNGEVPIETYKVIEIHHHHDGLDGYYNTFVGIPYRNVPHMTDEEAMPLGEEQSAVVVDNNDPKGMGRIRVQFEWQKARNEKTPWVRIVQSHAGSGKGSYFIPELGEEVLVGFEGRNAEKPVVLGMHYNGKEVSGFHTSENTIKAIKTRSGHLIQFTEEESIIITDKSGNEICLDTKGSNINITAPETITLKAKNIKMIAEENIESEAGKDMLNKAGKNIKTSAREEIAQDSGKKTIIASGDNTEISASKDLDLYGKKQLIGYSDAKVDIGAKDAIHIYGASSLITAKDKIEYKAPSMNKLPESGKFKFDKEKQIISAVWMDAKMEKEIKKTTVGKKVSLLVQTRNYEEGDTISVTVKEVDDKDIQEGVKEITLTGTVNKDGFAELKEQIEIGKLEEKPKEKTSEELKEEEEKEAYAKWEQEQWEAYQESKNKKGFLGL